MKLTLICSLVILVWIGTSSAKELPNALPDAPSAITMSSSIMFEPGVPVPVPAPKLAEVRGVDFKFVTLFLISTGSTFADSYTTMFAAQNWLAGKSNVCNVEVQSAFLYGTHPTAGRAYAVASAKTAGSLLAAYYLRKHHNKFWSLPLFATTATSLQGVTKNMRACN